MPEQQKKGIGRRSHFRLKPSQYPPLRSGKRKPRKGCLKDPINSLP
jgi:hypothetical protein